MNKTFLIGRTTKDIDLTETASGTKVVAFSLAVDRGTKDADGNNQTDFITCKAFNNQAEFISKYIKKGYKIMVEGRIQTGSYNKQDGTTVYTTDVIVERVENLTPREQEQPKAQAPQRPAMPQRPTMPPRPSVVVDDKDLPY